MTCKFEPFIFWILKQGELRHWHVAWFDQQPDYIPLQSAQHKISGISCFLCTSCSCSALKWNSIFIEQTEMSRKHAAVFEFLLLSGACLWEYTVIDKMQLMTSISILTEKNFLLASPRSYLKGPENWFCQYTQNQTKKLDHANQIPRTFL